MNGHADPAAERFARVEALLDAALDLAPDARAAWLATATDDATLRAEVEALLHAVDASDAFLEAGSEPAITAPPRIGPWRLTRRVGRGGMGEVWLGQRDDGRFEQQVAIKLLRRHRGDAARFQHEQRLLARLRHPGIAQIIDAGDLGDGSPYMVMEYVDGVPLLQHGSALGLDARLGLFLQVCEAVAFAHRHLIVHRDLKPDNILVRSDGRVALLDFGIAQLLDAGRDAPRMQGLTPRYAAPEQFSGAAPTTAVDVYALGLLLHELLTGQSPWGTSGVDRHAARIAPAPSTQAGSSTLARILRGDLDAIVGKALQVEPAARYASVEALADDLRRYRAHRPVQARGRAPAYRLARLLRRHWLAAASAALVFAGLVGALAAISLARLEALRERDIAQAEAARNRAVRDYLALMFRDASQASHGQSPLTAKQVLERAAARIDASFADVPRINAEVLKALGELHFHINDYTGAEPLLRRWLEREHEIDDAAAAADVRFTLAETVHRMGRREDAKALLAAAQAFWEREPARHADVLLSSRALQARLQREDGDASGALATLEAALQQRLQRSGRLHFETAALYTNLGAAYGQANRLDDGIAASREALALWHALDLDSGNDALNTLNNLGAMQFRRRDPAAAEQSFRQALALRRTAHGPSAATAALIGNYARALQHLGDAAQAVRYAAEAEAMAHAHAGASSPLTQAARVTHAELLLQLERAADAGAVLDAYSRGDPAALPASLRLRAALARADYEQRRGALAAARGHLDQAQSLLATAGAEAELSRPRLEALRARLVQ